MAELKNKPKVYVDGQAGTTGLEIIGRLQDRDDIELLMLKDELRHDDEARKAIMKESDLVFFCLPDQAAIEAESLCDDSTKIIDTSTAHRTSWTYGFPELDSRHKKEIAAARKVANPGCHATGFISIVYPLIQAGLIQKDLPVTAWSLTGYTGGGKKMIDEYENHKEAKHESPRTYGLNLMHKHIPEMCDQCSLQSNPVFVPIVDDYPRGMLVSIPFRKEDFTRDITPEKLREFYSSWYQDALSVKAASEADSGMLESGRLAGTDLLEIHVNGNDDQILVSALFDNLGKGASGAAVENMNLMLGLDPQKGLHLSAE